MNLLIIQKKIFQKQKRNCLMAGIASLKRSTGYGLKFPYSVLMSLIKLLVNGKVPVTALLCTGSIMRSITAGRHMCISVHLVSSLLLFMTEAEHCFLLSKNNSCWHGFYSCT